MMKPREIPNCNISYISRNNPCQENAIARVHDI